MVDWAACASALLTVMGELRSRLKTGQLIVRFSVIFLTGQIAKKPDCPVKNRTPGNPNLER